MPSLNDIRSTPDLSEVDGAVAIYLHGFGSNEQDLAGLAPLVTPDLPWVSLRAPLTEQPDSYAWFRITTPGNPDPGPVASATELVWEWIDANLSADAQIIAIGFSQGGLMATQLLRTRPDRVAATVILGGFVQGAVQDADARLAATRPPVFWGRGEQDRVIAPIAITRTSTWLPDHSTPEIRTYPGLAHGVNQAEIDDVRAFLTGIRVVGSAV